MQSCLLAVAVLDQHCNGGEGEAVDQCTLTPNVPTNFVEDCSSGNQPAGLPIPVY